MSRPLPRVPTNSSTLSTEVWSDYDVIALCNVGRLAEAVWRGLERFVAEGGGLLVVAGDLVPRLVPLGWVRADDDRVVGACRGERGNHLEEVLVELRLVGGETAADLEVLGCGGRFECAPLSVRGSKQAAMVAKWCFDCLSDPR